MYGKERWRATSAGAETNVIEVVKIAEVEFEVWRELSERVSHGVDRRTSREIDAGNMLCVWNERRRLWQGTGVEG